jgi:hypothetical protein
MDVRAMKGSDHDPFVRRVALDAHEPADTVRVEAAEARDLHDEITGRRATHTVEEILGIPFGRPEGLRYGRDATGAPSSSWGWADLQ